MRTQTIILYGRSGAGKGTQGDLLKKYISEHDPENSLVYVATGTLFRSFMGEDSYAARRVKEILDQGGLLPVFLAGWIWTDYINHNIKTGKEHLILDGAVRRPEEAPILDSAVQFLQRSDPVVLVINVSRERATEQLKKRGRYDDNDDDIKARLDWYDTYVVPAIGYFRENPRYRVLDIDGERTIEEVFEDIRKKLDI